MLDSLVVYQAFAALETGNLELETRYSKLPPTSSNNGLFCGQIGQAVAGSNGRYLPFGGWRTEPIAGLTDMGFTSHKTNNTSSGDIGLIYMNARYYLPSLNRFISADTIVPDPQDPQSYNRYSYALNNPVKYTDPSGHCVFIPPYDTAVCIALLALTLTGDTQHTPLSEAPQNITFGDVNMPCEYQLATCFAYEVPGVEEPIVWLKILRDIMKPIHFH